MDHEIMSFQMDAKLLYDVIKRQAGTLDKAFLEGCMNSIEAGSDFVEASFIPVDGDKPARLVIKDNGQGIRTRQEVVDFFNTFGKEHGSGEQVIWKQFRMGRGQLFSFGRNVWRTGPFRFDVDIKHHGLDWKLSNGLPFLSGCEIEVELYSNPLVYNYASEDVLVSCFRKQVEFMSVPILLNGKQISTSPEHCNWTYEDDDAYYLFGAGLDLRIYNIGAFCKVLPASVAGVTGVVVSKKMLQVNFARNDIQSECEVWQRIQEVIRENRVKRVVKSRRQLQSHEKISTLQDLRDGLQDWREVKSLGLFRQCDDRSISLDGLRKVSHPWTFAPLGDRRADRLMQTDAALCLDDSILDELEYDGDPDQFFIWLMKRAGMSAYEMEKLGWESHSRLYRPFASTEGVKGLSDGISNIMKLIPEKKWTRVERRIIKLLSGLNLWQGRRICIGTCDAALAWTDGHSYIALDRKYLKGLWLGHYFGWADLAHTMFHEMSHEEEDIGTHVHGSEFYRRFHEITYRCSGSYGCPFGDVIACCDRYRHSRVEEKQQEAEEKERKAEEKRRKKLGLDKPQQIAAREVSAPPCTSAPVIKKKVTKKKVVKKRVKRRLTSRKD